MAGARAASSSATILGSNRSNTCRRLIVDTDLGLDDLVALSLLRVQQAMLQQTNHCMSFNDNLQYTPFRLSGVTISSGISCASDENAALLRRLLPPDTPVYVSGTFGSTTPLSWIDEDKPTWWKRTAQRVASVLASLPVLPIQQTEQIMAEKFIANNMDNPDVDILCMAPLTTIANALKLRSEQHPNSSPQAGFYVMGGIRSDSKQTKRGAPTAPFGYRDVVGGANEAASDPDQFGEFNFALDIAAARTVLTKVSAHIIPLEACTLVPECLRSIEDSDNVSSMLSLSKDIPCSGDSVSAKELYTARSNLLKLLRLCGTDETQWDSIAAAIYCNAFESTCASNCTTNDSMTHFDSRQLRLSDLGALYFPGCPSDEMLPDTFRGYGQDHQIYPVFSIEMESSFYHYLSFLLYS